MNDGTDFWNLCDIHTKSDLEMEFEVRVYDNLEESKRVLLWRRSEGFQEEEEEEGGQGFQIRPPPHCMSCCFSDSRAQGRSNSSEREIIHNTHSFIHSASL